MHVNFGFSTYQISYVDHLNGIMNHILATGMGPLIEHGLIEDQGHFDEFLDRSDVTLDLFFVLQEKFFL